MGLAAQTVHLTTPGQLVTFGSLRMSRHAVRRCIGVALVTTLIACGERPAPTAPGLTTFDAPAQLLRAGNAKQAKVLGRANRLKHDVSASALISPAGGFLGIAEAGLLVYFPRGAVSQSVVVTVTAQRGKDLVYSFEPHGLTFNVPIVVAQELSFSAYSRKQGESSPEVQGGYLAGGTADIDASGTASLAEAFPVRYREYAGRTYLLFTTTHFSSYTFASGRCESSGTNVLAPTVDLP